MQRFVRERLGADFWRTVEADVNVSGRVYLPSQSYPMAELEAVVASVSRHSGMSIPLLLESIGDYVAPDMLGAYSNMIDPNWSVLDIALRSEAIVEKAALKHGLKVENTPLQGRAGNNGEIILTYQAVWRLCPLIKGLLRGLGAHLDQPVLMDEFRCMSTGSAACELAIRAERTRSSRTRLASSPGGLGALKVGSFERADRPSSLPPAPGTRSDPNALFRQTWGGGRVERQSVPPPAPTPMGAQRSPLPSVPPEAAPSHLGPDPFEIRKK